MGKIVKLILIILLFNSCMVAEIDIRRAFDSDRIIVSEEDSFTFVQRVGRTVRKRTDIEFEGFSGTYTLLSLNSQEGDFIEVAFRTQIKSGQFKLVLIDPDKNIQTIIAMSGSGQRSISLKKGISRIKMIGRESTGIISFEIRE